MQPSTMAMLWLSVLGGCATQTAPATPTEAQTASVRFIRQQAIAECLAATGGNPVPCQGIEWRDGSAIEIGRIDVDGDGDQDLVIRRLSPLTCGSKGCSTDIYLVSDKGLTIAEPRLVTAGPIATCVRNGARGLRPIAARSASCFLFQPASH